ncbi:hypothetical protein [Nostoc sp.]|uniref:hypothetical protein n=1 Tax=Nostoc sp. TaxID=1180 RepID=UPI002FF724D5
MQTAIAPLHLQLNQKAIASPKKKSDRPLIPNSPTVIAPLRLNLKQKAIASHIEREAIAPFYLHSNQKVIASPKKKSDRLFIPKLYKLQSHPSISISTKKRSPFTN